MPTTHPLTLFLFIFLAAAPGRTTFILMMLASQGSLKKIWIGAAAAFLIQSFISVLLGGLLVFLPQNLVHLAAGVLFIFFGFKFWQQSQSSTDLRLTEQNISIKAVFLIVFLAEFGDVSQLAIATAAANSTSKATVFLLAVLSLWLITAMALLLGYKLKTLIGANFIQKIASLAFFVVGGVLMSQALLKMVEVK